MWVAAGFAFGHLDVGAVGWVLVAIAGFAAGGLPAWLLSQTRGRRWVRDVLLPEADRTGVLPEWVLTVLEGSMTCGELGHEVECGPGTHLELPLGASFGPFVAGPDGVRLYEVMLDKPLELRDARAIAAGVELENGDKTQPCEIDMEDRDRQHLRITLYEGKNREVRRLFEHFGYEVTRLDRKLYAGISTRGLARGEWRRLERKEISALRRLVDLE